MLELSPVLLASALLCVSSHALRLPIERRAVPSPNVIVNKTASGDNEISHVGPLYTVPVNIQGRTYNLALYTGGPDTFVALADSNTRADPYNLSSFDLIETKVNVSAAYTDGPSYSGSVVFGNVSVGEYIVEGQAFLNAVVTDYTSFFWHGSFLDGALGLGPSSNSPIVQKLVNTSYDGTPFMENVFNHGPLKDPYVSVLLPRDTDTWNKGGNFTIGETVAEYDWIQRMPKLPVIGGAWVTLMDGVYVGDKLLTGHSGGFNRSPVTRSTNQTFVSVSIGEPSLTAPPYYVDAIYKNLPGARFVKDFGTYQVPCSTKLNISLQFGDYNYPIDPLDATTIKVTDGKVSCIGSIAYTPPEIDVDFLLGSAFLLNVYSLLNYGNWTTAAAYGPYMQFISITNQTEAWQNFEELNVRRIMKTRTEYIANTTLSSTSAANSASSSPVSSSVAISPSTGVSMKGAVSDARAMSSAVIPSHSPAATTSPTHSTVSPPRITSQSRVSETFDEVHETVTRHPIRVSTRRPPRVTAKPKEELLQQDLASAPISPPTSILSELERDSYIIIGLMSATLLLLVGVVVKVVMGGRKQSYHAVHDKPGLPRDPEYY